MIQEQEMMFSCPAAKKCGGCSSQKLTYAKQLEKKQQLCHDLLKSFCHVEPILGMEQPFHYRNKVHRVFGRDHKGMIVNGIYEAGTHHIIPVKECLIEDKECQEIIQTIFKMLRSFKIKTYDEDTGYGLLRHVLVRKGFTSGEIMVVLVLSSPVFPSKNNFLHALLKAHPGIKTVVLNVNNRRTSMILGDKETVLYGKGTITDQLCGCTFRISPKSFYQVNPVQTERLYQTAVEYAGLTGNETVIDAYCGIGTIGIIASGKAKKVISVELNHDALRDARANARANKADNVEFYENDAGEFIRDMAQDGYHADVIFLDPPRAGSDETFLSSALTIRPSRIVYISCNPETLARDLKYLTRNGYKAKKAQPVDMFPGTDHVETVCLLTHKD